LAQAELFQKIAEIFVSPREMLSSVHQFYAAERCGHGAIQAQCDDAFTTLDTLGSFYVPPGKGERVLTGLNANDNVRLTFHGDFGVDGQRFVAYQSPHHD